MRDMEFKINFLNCSCIFHNCQHIITISICIKVLKICFSTFAYKKILSLKKARETYRQRECASRFMNCYSLIYVFFISIIMFLSKLRFASTWKINISFVSVDLTVIMVFLWIKINYLEAYKKKEYILSELI